MNPPLKSSRCVLTWTVGFVVRTRTAIIRGPAWKYTSRPSDDHVGSRAPPHSEAPCVVGRAQAENQPVYNSFWNECSAKTLDRLSCDLRARSDRS